MVLSFTGNLVLSLLDPVRIVLPRELGIVFLACGSLFFTYVLFYLRGGFFGETDPNLDCLVTRGPYGYCRHPLYLSFLIMILGMDLVLGSIVGVLCTFLVAVPSVVYRAGIEDRLLRNKFGEKWEDYANRTGFLLPRLRRGKMKTERDVNVAIAESFQ